MININILSTVLILIIIVANGLLLHISILLTDVPFTTDLREFLDCERTLLTDSFA